MIATVRIIVQAHLIESLKLVVLLVIMLEMIQFDDN